MTPNMVWISGMSQGGTTLLLSLLDAHPELSVYPDEPSFQRIVERTGYANASHILADFLFGTPNPMHFAAEAGLAADPSSRFSPAVPADAIACIPKALQWCIEKKISGLENNQDVPHARFMQRYTAHLIDQFNATQPTQPRAIIDLTFEAFEAACHETGIATAASYRAFKIPFSQLERTGFDWFKQLYPQGKIIFISRDPLSRLQSRVKHHSQGQARSSLRQRLKLIESTAGDEQIFRRMIPNNPDAFFITYEDLVTDTSATLERIYAFIGIAVDQNIGQITKLGFPSTIRTNRTNSKTVSTASLGAAGQAPLMDRILYSLFRIMPPYFLMNLWIKLRAR